MQLGSMAQLGAGIGRSMSPVAGAGIIIAGTGRYQPYGNGETQCRPMYYCDCSHHAIVTLVQ